MSTDDDAQALIHLVGMESLLERSRDALADRLDDAEVIRVVERAAFLMGGRTEAGAALWLPGLQASAARLGLLSPVTVGAMSIAAGSSIAAH
jgi:hypothetical protein